MNKQDIKNRTSKVIDELVKEQSDKKITNPLDAAYNEEFAKAITAIGDDVQVVVNKEEIAEKIPLVVIRHLNDKIKTVSEQREKEYETATMARRAELNGSIMAATVVEKEYRSIISEFAAEQARALQK